MCSISITFVYIKQILDDVEYDIINYRLWKKLFEHFSRIHTEKLTAWSDGKVQ